MTSVSLLRQPAKLGDHFFNTANPARLYKHLLGDTDAYAPDRTAADAIYETANWCVSAAVINRDYSHRSIRWSLDRGVRQFLDLGCGYPGRVNVHNITGTVQAGCPVVYVDHDPGVWAHARMLDGERGVTVIRADLLAMEQLLTCEAVREAFNLDEPVAVLLHDVLVWCTQDLAVHRAMAILREWMPVGSTLSITHLTDHWHRATTMRDVEAVYTNHGLHICPRSRAEILRLFGDFIQQEQGLAATGRWHTQGKYVHHPEEHSAALAGIAVKPARPATTFLEAA